MSWRRRVQSRVERRIVGVTDEERGGERDVIGSIGEARLVGSSWRTEERIRCIGSQTPT